MRIHPGPGDRRRTPTAWRALAFLVALFVLLTSLSAEAKKKKPAKKHKTPSASSKSKSSGAEAAPESDEASSDEKTPSKAAAEPDEGEEKPAKTPPPAAESEEEAAAKKPVKKAAPAAAEGETAPGGPIALSLGVGGKALFRKLTWTDSANMLAPYTLSPGPEVALWLEAYPAAFASDGFAANIGLFANFDYGVGASSKLPAAQGGGKLDTKYQDFLAGLKVRIPLGMVLPYVAVGYGMQKFHLEPADVTRPNFNYSFVSAGGGARFQFLPIVYADLGAAFLYVLNPGSSAGEVAAPGLYPNATGNGVDVSLSVGVRVFGMVGLRAGGDFRQFGVASHWKTGDPSIKTGGATDRNISVWGGVEIEFDRMGGGESEPAPAPKKPAGKGKKSAPRDVEPDESSGSAPSDTEE